ncbi:Rrf2 family transcriptional regulator [Roseomonas mucosa]|uniref:Rrf2 family transcriptional regulator n=1 Tax=Roseomonas mucosa TaxID=207340 RepID=UPI0028CD90A9|nr:Rrf2 family transcriptional regulator [Roseomonas mucosa]MDT8278849.1 Rrf2 family transcriptional regulator [Roseomonas mucosa]
MRLTRFTDYSQRALMFLCLRDGENSSIAEIASAYGISEHHLTKVVHRLGQLGLVQTTRGRNGGLRLGRRPEDIVLGQVVRQTEEDLAIVECFGGGCCPIAGVCELQRALAEALQAFLLVLDRHTLADLVRPRAAALAGRLGLSAAEGAARP